MLILVPHGVHPTGFGVGADDRFLFLLTPCCGAEMFAARPILCSRCPRDFSEHPLTDEWNLTFHPELTLEDYNYESVVVPWMADCLGVSSENLEIKVVFNE